MVLASLAWQSVGGRLVWSACSGGGGRKNGTMRCGLYPQEHIVYLQDKNIDVKLFKTRVTCN